MPAQQTKHSRRTFIKSAAFAAGALALSVSFAGRAAEKATGAVAEAGKSLLDYMKDRINSIYARDKAMPKRASQDNPEIVKIYRDFLGEPMSEKAEHFLHREMTDKSAPLKKLAKKRLYPYPRLKNFENRYPFELD